LFYFSCGMSVVLFYSWLDSDIVLVVVGQLFYFIRGWTVILFLLW
jgi:hypothetical protein